VATSLDEKIEDFTRFAKSHSSEDVTIDELYDRWRERTFQETDALAVEASLRDMEQGETGRPFDEFAGEFRKRNNLSESS